MSDLCRAIDGASSCATGRQDLEAMFTMRVASCIEGLAGPKVRFNSLNCYCNWVTDLFLQSCSSWNSEIAQIYPQFSLEAINKLEMVFCREIGWNLYISSSTYAKYYFALRSLTEKSDFRRYSFIISFCISCPTPKLINSQSGIIM